MNIIVDDRSNSQEILRCISVVYIKLETGRYEGDVEQLSFHYCKMLSARNRG